LFLSFAVSSRIFDHRKILQALLPSNAFAGTFIFSGFWPVVAIYFVMALLMRPEPVVSFISEGDEAFYHSYVESRGIALGRLRKTFDDLQRRIQRIESIVTSREYDWEQRLRNG